jgi:5'-nucleotidase
MPWRACHGVFSPSEDPTVLILLTNDDGIYAPGIAALERELRQIGDVLLCAPATEQSGVGHSITFLSPLVVKEVFEGDRRRGWAVEGSPADSVKIGIFEFCPRRPDIVVSGINGGLNAGINVLYSGTVAAAIEGAFFGITSVAVSLEYDEHARFDKAAKLARSIIEQIRSHQGTASHLYNINIPTAALETQPELHVVPMGVAQYGERYERRKDPRGRTYYWMAGDPPSDLSGPETDLIALKKGHVTLTPLDFNLTNRTLLDPMASWRWTLPDLRS